MKCATLLHDHKSIEGFFEKPIPEDWDEKSTLVNGARACFRWQENISPVGYNHPSQPVVNIDWFLALGIALSLKRGCYLLCPGEWETANGQDSNRTQLKGNGIAHFGRNHNSDRPTLDVADIKGNHVTESGIIGLLGNVSTWTDPLFTERDSHHLRSAHASVLGGSYDSATVQGLLTPQFMPLTQRSPTVGVRIGISIYDK